MDENRAAGTAGPPTSKIQALVGGPIGYSGPGREGARQAAAEVRGAASTAEAAVRGAADATARLARQAYDETAELAGQTFRGGPSNRRGAGGLSLELETDSRGLAWIIGGAALGYALAFAIHAWRHWDATERNPARTRRSRRH